MRNEAQNAIIQNKKLITEQKIDGYTMSLISVGGSKSMKSDSRSGS